MIDAKLMNWLRRLANERHLGDDAVQEAALAIWSVLQKRPDAPNSYLVGVAKRQMASVACGRAFTGHAPMRGREDASRHSRPLADTEDFVGLGDEYGRSEVRAAVKSLSPRDREIVVSHFWEGRPFTKPGWARWSAHIKPQLRYALEAS